MTDKDETLWGALDRLASFFPGFSLTWDWLYFCCGAFARRNYHLDAACCRNAFGSSAA